MKRLMKPLTQLAAQSTQSLLDLWSAAAALPYFHAAKS